MANILSCNVSITGQVCVPVAQEYSIYELVCKQVC